jgi:hypothetical protein
VTEKLTPCQQQLETFWLRLAGWRSLGDVLAQAAEADERVLVNLLTAQDDSPSGNQVMLTFAIVVPENAIGLGILEVATSWVLAPSGPAQPSPATPSSRSGLLVGEIDPPTIHHSGLAGRRAKDPRIQNGVWQDSCPLFCFKWTNAQ